MIEGRSTGCPNLASCYFCDCKLSIKAEPGTVIISNPIPGFRYIVSCDYIENTSKVKSEKPDARKEHSKHLMKLQKKRF